jgi:hypothetical protein
MSVLGNLIALIAGKFGLFLASLFGAQMAFRIQAVIGLALMYISCVTLFQTVIAGWWSGLLGTSLGMLLGLLSPRLPGPSSAACRSTGCV